MMLFYFHGGDAPLWAIVLWVVVIPVLIIGLIVYIAYKFSENSKAYKKNANPLSLDKASDKTSREIHSNTN